MAATTAILVNDALTPPDAINLCDDALTSRNYESIFIESQMGIAEIQTVLVEIDTSFVFIPFKLHTIIVCTISIFVKPILKSVQNGIRLT